MDGRVDATWLYYKLFLGRATDKTDQFIVKTIARARSQNDISNWFFLRYYEAGEFQLRLRVKPVASAYEFQVTIVSKASMALIHSATRALLICTSCPCTE